MAGLESRRSNEGVSGCEFCRAPEKRATQAFRRLYGIDQVLDIRQLSENFFVMQNIVPLGVGGSDVMLIPKPERRSHHTSLSQVKNQQELRGAADLLAMTLHRFYPNNPIYTFEHGPGVIEGEHIDCGGCHVDHAHGHMIVLPPDWSLGPLKEKTEELLKGSGWKDLESRTHRSNIIFAGVEDIAGISPYLQIGMIEPDGRHQSITYVQSSSNEGTESELERRVVAEVVYPNHVRSAYRWRDVADGLVPQERIAQIGNTLRNFRARIESGKL